MKKIITLIILGALLVPVVGLAQESKIVTTLEKIRDTLWTFLIIVAAICFIFAGFLFLTAGGDPNKVNTAKQAVFYGLVGVLVAALANTLVALVEGWVK